MTVSPRSKEGEVAERERGRDDSVHLGWQTGKSTTLFEERERIRG